MAKNRKEKKEELKQLFEHNDVLYESSFLELIDDIYSSKGGYSHTGAFAGKPLTNQYVWESGIGINYTTSDVSNSIYKTFSLDESVHNAVDNPYWSDPAPTGATGIGLFQGAHLPEGIDTLIDYTYDYDAENSGITHSYYQYNGNQTGHEGTIGRIVLNQCEPGDLLKVRFDFNVIPQIANTTIEPALWYSNRNENDEITFSFPLTGQPIFFGTGTVQKTYLNRVELSAWITSTEDLNALALPSIKSDNPVIIQPLGLLISINR